MNTRLAGHILVAALLVLAVLALCLGPSVSRPAALTQSRGALAITYVANMGIMAATDGTKILIDALFDEPNPDYRAPGPDVVEKMVYGTSPFDGVSLALETHNHPDHFDPRLALRFMLASHDAVLVMPTDAAAAMRAVAVDWPAVSPRIVPIDLAVGGQVTRKIKGVTVTAIRTLHSGNRPSPLNLMYVVAFSGWRLFHEGDSPSDPREYEQLGLDRERFDLALVHFWLALSPEHARFLQQTFKADHIALGHLPIRLEEDAPAKIESVRKYYKDLFLLLPGTKVRLD